MMMLSIAAGLRIVAGLKIVAGLSGTVKQEGARGLEVEARSRVQRA
ncbi:hypothetical protein LWF15_35380 [Kineosporia rhizophila]|nr:MULTISPECIES: hypothetical protein [Kineosporia]MCE0540786.1 hypothetical protein [Kineosporia rhizophila]